MISNPWQLEGDEIDSLGDSWMFILWSSDSSPFLTNSMSSRFPIAVVPASRYTLSESGVNLTLEAIAAHVVQSFNRLSLHGIKVRDTGSLRPRAAFGLQYMNVLSAYFGVSDLYWDMFESCSFIYKSPNQTCRTGGGLATILCDRFPWWLESHEGYVFVPKTLQHQWGHGLTIIFKKKGVFKKHKWW